MQYVNYSITNNVTLTKLSKKLKKPVLLEIETRFKL